MERACWVMETRLAKLTRHWGRSCGTRRTWLAWYVRGCC
jgi:hypothetical protein